MCPRFAAIAVAVAASAMTAGAADATTTCYLVYDAKGNVVYRDQVTPVDLSARGAADRDAMRRRGELLLIFDTDRCGQIITAPASTGGSARLAIDEFIAGVKPALGSGAAAPTSPGRTGPAPAEPPAAPAAPAAPRRSSSPGSY